MFDTPLISIILPVYNVERYLLDCLDSLYQQTSTDFEVIAIDDGSTDHCGQILDQHATIHPQLNVIHQANQGLSGARNTGIDIAKGQYFLFVDSDDWLDFTCIEKIEGMINDHDLLLFGHNRVYADHTDTIRYDTSIVQQAPLNATQLMHYNALNPSPIDHMAWGKLFDRRLFSNVRFPVGRKHEDLATTYQLYAITRSAVFLNEPLYNYRIVDDSIAHQLNPKTAYDKLLGFYEQYRFYRDHKLADTRSCGDKVVACLHSMHDQIASSDPYYKKAIDLVNQVDDLSLKYRLMRRYLCR